MVVWRTRPLDGRVVLIVDDHTDTVEMLVTCFKAHGATALTAINAVEARAHLTRQSVDLIVADIAMPRENGVRMMGRIRSDPKWSKVPAIAISGQVDPLEIANEYPGLFDAGLSKPLDLPKLVEIATSLTASPAGPS
jgi:CheY-like chemotaxis protein